MTNEMIKNEIYTIWYNDRHNYADVEFIGRNRKGDYKMESITYGWVYLVSKDFKTVTLENGKVYEMDSIC